MDLDTYQIQAGRTAVYPEAGTGSVGAVTYLALGLGEAGEVQGKVKKILRDDDGVITDEKRIQILDEIGDLLWYAALLSDELGARLSDVAGRNLDKLAGRQRRGVLGGSGDTR